MTNTFPIATAQVQTTLAALAYAADTRGYSLPPKLLGEKDTYGKEIQNKRTRKFPSMDVVKARIQAQLASGKYATGTDWSLVWGPIETTWTDNLVYIAKNSVDGALAVCLRGTTTEFLSRVEDIPTGQTTFPNGNKIGATVGTEFYNALHEILNATDPVIGTTIFGYLAGNITKGQTVYVNGHSQGAALVPMAMCALKNGWNIHIGIAANFKGFAIAPPTSGNPIFSQWVNDNLDCWFIVNPLDIVPLGYADIANVSKDDILGPLPGGWEGIILGAAIDIVEGDAYVSGPWAQPSQRAITHRVPLTVGTFLTMIGDQHNHNSYLHLLGAPQISNDAAGTSPMTGAVTPPYVTT